MNPYSIKNRGPLKKSVVVLEDRNRAFVFSPMRLMTTLLLSVFVVETIVMLVLEDQEPVGWHETLIDSSVLKIGRAHV